MTLLDVKSKLGPRRVGVVLLACSSTPPLVVTGAYRADITVFYCCSVDWEWAESKLFGYKMGVGEVKEEIDVKGGHRGVLSHLFRYTPMFLRWAMTFWEYFFGESCDPDGFSSLVFGFLLNTGRKQLVKKAKCLGEDGVRPHRRHLW